MSGWNSHIAAQKCTVQLRRLVRMRFLYQPIIPPRMVAMGFPSRRSESLVLCGRTEAAKRNYSSVRWEARTFRRGAPLEKKLKGRSTLRIETQSQLQSALRITDHLRRRFAGFKLCAHFLQARSKRLNLLLLLCKL